MSGAWIMVEGRGGAAIGRKWKALAARFGARQLPPGVTRLKSGKASQRRAP